jgi:hypothetical protein
MGVFVSMAIIEILLPCRRTKKQTLGNDIAALRMTGRQCRRPLFYLWPTTVKFIPILAVRN